MLITLIGIGVGYLYFKYTVVYLYWHFRWKGINESDNPKRAMYWKVLQRIVPAILALVVLVIAQLLVHIIFENNLLGSGLMQGFALGGALHLLSTAIIRRRGKKVPEEEDQQEDPEADDADNQA